MNTTSFSRRTSEDAGCCNCAQLTTRKTGEIPQHYVAYNTQQSYSQSSSPSSRNVEMVNSKLDESSTSICDSDESLDDSEMAPAGLDVISSLESLVNNRAFSDVCFCVGIMNSKIYSPSIDFRVSSAKMEDEGVDDGKHTKNIYALRAILSCRSPVFRALLYGFMIEARDPKHVIRIPDITPEAFMVMLRYIYTDKVDTISTANVLSALYAANKYELPHLREACVEFVERRLACDTVFALLETSAKTPTEAEIVNMCCSYIQKHGDEILKSDSFFQLSKSMLLEVVKNQHLKVSSELVVFEGVVNWGRAECARLNLTPTLENLRECLHDVLPYVRFSLMTSNQFLGPVQKSDILDPSHILPIATYISTKESKGIVESLGYNLRPREPILTFREFTHENDLDENGIIYFIGTKDGIQPFTNPHLAGEMRVNFSSVASGRVEMLVGRLPNPTLFTNSNPGSFVVIDFGQNRRVGLTHYTLQNGYASTSEALRNWVIEGCNPDVAETDNKEEETITTPFPPPVLQNVVPAENPAEQWHILRTHTQDTALGGNFGSHTWEIDNAGHDIEERSFQKFRIRSTGQDSSGSNYVVLGGVEFYGRLYEKDW